MDAVVHNVEVLQRHEPRARNILEAAVHMHHAVNVTEHCAVEPGTYNLDQPDIAASLGEKKAHAVIATGAEIVASGNIGCLTQVRLHLARLGSRVQVRHTMQVLRDAYLGLP